MSTTPLKIYDPLYGEVVMPGWVTDVLRTPELQRLREVSLFNSSSWNMTGTTGASRFEHVIGSGYLATRNIAARGLHSESVEARALVVAALIHDVATAAFGHTIERVLTPLGFSHASVLLALRNDYTALSDEPFFAGAPARLASVVAPEVLGVALDAVLGEPPLGPLIAGDLDLDNIDNVTRGAMYLGLKPRADLATELAEAHTLEDGGVGLRDGSEGLVLQWQGLRRSLYELLFESKAQVAREAMIFLAARRMVSIGQLSVADWRRTDHEMIRLFEEAKDELLERIGRHLRLGRTFAVSHQFRISGPAARSFPSDDEFQASTAVLSREYRDADWFFSKVDSRQVSRAITRVSRQGEVRTFGEDSNSVSITVLSKRTEIDPRRLARERPLIARDLGMILGCDVVDSFGDQQPALFGAT